MKLWDVYREQVNCDTLLCFMIKFYAYNKWAYATITVF